MAGLVNHGHRAWVLERTQLRIREQPPTPLKQARKVVSPLASSTTSRFVFSRSRHDHWRSAGPPA